MTKDLDKVLNIVLKNYEKIKICQESLCFACDVKCITNKINNIFMKKNYKFEFTGACELRNEKHKIILKFKDIEKLKNLSKL